MHRGQKVVAITGGIGSGKSAVAKIFQELGACIVDADLLAREVVEPGSEGLQEIQRAFPDEALILADGSLNRSKLAELIFTAPDKKRIVESILHPKIRALWLARLEQLKSSGVAVIAYIVPLFFESASQMPELKKVILVTAPEEVRIQRVMARDGFTRAATELRLQAQLPDSKKIARSDYVIHNDSSLEELRAQVEDVYKRVLGDG